jgi:hypothetical protein
VWAHAFRNCRYHVGSGEVCSDSGQDGCQAKGMLPAPLSTDHCLQVLRCSVSTPRCPVPCLLSLHCPLHRSSPLTHTA